jgi:hypothetical protein
VEKPEGKTTWTSTEFAGLECSEDVASNSRLNCTSKIA